MPSRSAAATASVPDVRRTFFELITGPLRYVKIFVLE
jgi:hypothetical protein